MDSRREMNYDLLRIVAMVAVIATHVSGTWLNGIWDFAVAGMPMGELSHPFMGPLYFSIMRFAVPCFVMLSGAFVMQDTRNREYRYFYHRAWKKIGIPTLVFSVIYIVYGLLSCIWGADAGPIARREFLKQVISGTPHYHMWYLYMLGGVYVLTPLAIRFKESIADRTYVKAVSVFMVLASISAWTTYGRMMSWDVGMVFEYLGYFMMGDVIRSHVKKKSNGKGILLVLAGILIEGALSVYVYRINYVTVTDMYEIQLRVLEYLGIPIAAASILIFTGFSYMHIKERGWIVKLSSLSLYVYLFHALVYDLIRKGFYMATHVRIYMYRYLDGLYMIPLLTVVVLLISIILASAWIALDHKWNKKQSM